MGWFRVAVVVSGGRWVVEVGGEGVEEEQVPKFRLCVDRPFTPGGRKEKRQVSQRARESVRKSVS